MSSSASAADCQTDGNQSYDDFSSSRLSIPAGSTLSQPHSTTQSQPSSIHIVNTEHERNHSIVEQEEMRAGTVTDETTVASASVVSQRSDIGNRPLALTRSAKSVTTGSIAASMRSGVHSTFSRRTRTNTVYSSGEESHLRPATSIHVNMSQNESQIEIPMPIMPYETRKDKFKQLSVLVLCLIVSLAITLTCGQGRLGLDTALIMYPKDSIPFTAAVLRTDVQLNMADIDEPIATERGADTAVFWYIPKSGAKYLGILLFQCLGLVEASNIGSGSTENELQFIEDEVLNIRYVNVDTTTREGITRAKSLHLGSSGLPDVIGTPLVSDIVDLFDPSHRGRFFTVLRDPIDRALALFESEKGMNPDLIEWTLTDFVQSTKYQSNFLAWSLTNKNPSDITPEDMVSAKKMLHDKFVIGLFDKMEESFVRFEKYFGWSDLIKTESMSNCIESNMPGETLEGSHHLFSLPLIRENAYDLQLYDYAKELFEIQDSLVLS